jgi:hypothetical protein
MWKVINIRAPFIIKLNMLNDNIIKIMVPHFDYIEISAKYNTLLRTILLTPIRNFVLQLDICMDPIDSIFTKQK